MSAQAAAAHAASRPIGVFDSGIGGLSVLQALRRELPHEHFVYFSDAAHAPYGERSEGFVVERSLAVAQQLVHSQAIKALVVACNTATAAAIQRIRASHPGLIVLGLEPALKPAVLASRSGRIAVFATRGTLASRKFALLRDGFTGRAEFRLVACDGLAAAIEADDTAAIQQLARRYVAQGGPFGNGPAQADTLVLGCTHYPLIVPVLRPLLGDAVQIVDTGAPVARHTRRLLTDAGLLAQDGGGAVDWCSSASPAVLQGAAARWLVPGSPALATQA